MTVAETQKSRRAGAAVRAAGLLIALSFSFFFVVLGLSVYREHESAQSQAEMRSLSASLVVSTNVRWLNQMSRQSLQRIDDALGDSPATNAGQSTALIREAVDALPGDVKTYVVAADGRTLSSTDPNFKPIDIRDREYFSALANGQQWYNSPLLVSRLDGKQIFVMSKRLERNGAFMGAAIISYDVTLFQEIWQSLTFDNASTVSVVRDDGQLVARFPLAPGPQDLSGYVLFTNYLKTNAFGTYRTVSPTDGVERIVGYRRVPGSNLVALASVAVTSAMMPFWQHTQKLLFFALPTALMLLASSAWILRLLQRDRARNADLIRALDHNRMLVRDTHHRVKNNLQSIASMIRIHPLPDVLKADLQSRISAMSAVHEHLYRSDEFADVDVKSLIPAIMDGLVHASAFQNAVVTYDLDEAYVPHEAATPFALVLNEVGTNALKYGGTEEAPPKIEVTFKKLEGNKYRLSVSDGGRGFDPSQGSRGLGIKLIRAMASQLGAEYRYRFAPGTTFELDLAVAATPALAAQP